MPLTFTQATAAFIRYRTAEGKSPYTLRNYRTSFAKLQTYLAAHGLPDPPLAAITRQDLIGFFAWLQTDYRAEPAGCAPRGQIKLSAKTILNTHTDLSSLWHWAAEENYLPANLLRTIHPDHPSEPVVEPFTQKEVEALLAACEHKKTWQKVAIADVPYVDRDKAIVLLLLDSGLRASELCDIRLADLDMNTNSITVTGKGDKRRIVHFGRRTAKALWRLITARIGKDKDADARLFTVGTPEDPHPLDRNALRHIVNRLAERAGITNVYPHRFRHTFAITYLRNGGDLFTLQALLGHSDLEMVRRYARIAQTDCAKAHQKASPVDNWRL